MSKKILIIDNLTQTFDSDIVKSGLQRSSLLDAKAFSKYFDTTYAYCGEYEFKEKFHNLKLSDMGAKDRCIMLGQSPKTSFKYIKKYMEEIKDEYDFIICHCHSISMFNKLNEIVKDRKILFIVHDVLDLTYMYGLSNSIRRLRELSQNDFRIYTNSNYSVQKANFIYNRRKKFDILSGDDIFDGYIKHFVYTEEKPDIVESDRFSAVVGRYESKKNHHKLYKYKNDNHKIIHFGIKDPIRDEGLKYYNTLIKRCNEYKEGLGDEELNAYLQFAKYIIIPCWHEGFGFTAFEAGIYGAKAIILYYDKPSQINIHATDEFLTNADVPHIMIPYGDEKRLFEELNKEVTFEERKEISSKLLKYFTVANYVNERIDIFRK